MRSLHGGTRRDHGGHHTERRSAHHLQRARVAGRALAKVRAPRMGWTLRVCAVGATAVIVLAGCMGDEGARTVSDGNGITTQAEAPGAAGPANAARRVTIDHDGTTVTIEPLRDVSFHSNEGSFLTIQGEVGGRAAIRTGECGNPGQAVVGLGTFYGLLASTVDIKLDELTGGGHALTIDDSFCVKLQPA